MITKSSATKASDEHKRSLSFDALDDIVADVKSLLETGYIAHGNWDLAQTCAHLAEWIRFPMDGFPRPAFPIRAMFWVMKVTVAKSMKKKILAEGFKSGMPTAPPTVFPPGATPDADAVAHLVATIERAESFTGDLHPSPLFGAIDKDTAKKVTLLHAEHHLGYLEPK